MKRWVFTIFSVLSLALCAATCFLWVRGEQTKDTVRKSFDKEHLYQVESYRGVLILERVWLEPDSDIASAFQHVQWDSDSFPLERGYEEDGNSMDSVCWRKAGRIGFGYSKEFFDEGIAYVVVIPFWFVALISVCPPVSLAVGWIRALFRHAGRCNSCGYDLRATPNRCPECGTVPQGVKA